MNVAVARQPRAALCTIGDAPQAFAGDRHARDASVDPAEAIFDPPVGRHAAWRRAAPYGEPLRSYRARAEAQRDSVLGKARDMLAHGHDPGQTLEYLANALTGKLLHTTSVRLHEAAEHGDRDLLDAAARLFDADGQRE